MTNTESKQQRADRLINREVHACVSNLVSTLAQGYGMGTSREGRELVDLTEQAFELASPIPDYEEAAFEAGWKKVGRDAGLDWFSRGTSITGADVVKAASWEALCNEDDIEPYDREVYEHWIVSPWLADKLEAKGEKVDRDFAGLTVWARTTTGQTISIDAVIESIVEDIYANT